MRNIICMYGMLLSISVLFTKETVKNNKSNYKINV